MKKLWLGSIIVMMIAMVPVLSVVQASVRITVPLPPPLSFVVPPHVVVLPGTDIYVVPDLMEDLFFQNGWWWRYWDNRWYRSRYYDHGWDYYRGYPSWHRRIPPNWRDNYRDHRWQGRPWNPPRIHRDHLDRHWRDGRWRRDHGWEQPGGPGRPGPGRIGGPEGPGINPPVGPGPDRGGAPGGRGNRGENPALLR